METQCSDIPSKWIDCLDVGGLVSMDCLVVRCLHRMDRLVARSLDSGQLPFQCIYFFKKSSFLRLLYKIVGFMLTFLCMHCSDLFPPISLS